MITLNRSLPGHALRALAFGTLFIAMASGVAADVVAFDNYRLTPSGLRPGGSVFNTSRWAGQAINLDAGAPSQTITGFDVPVLHSAAGSGLLPGQLRLRVRVYDTYSSSSSPVFGSLLGEQTIVAPYGTVAGTVHYTPWTGSPQLVLPTPITVSGLSSIGIAMIYEVNTGGGWIVDPTIMTVGLAAATGPTVGSTAMPLSSTYYLRHLAAGAPFGNFNPSDLYTPGSAFAGIDMRVWVVPTPGALALLGLGGLMAGRRRR